MIIMLLCYFGAHLAGIIKRRHWEVTADCDFDGGGGGFKGVPFPAHQLYSIHKCSFTAKHTFIKWLVKLL